MVDFPALSNIDPFIAKFDKTINNMEPCVVMEPDLEEFLREREAVTEDILQVMKTEKIDKAAISVMRDEDLKKFVPKMGDRMAIMKFCKTVSCSLQNRLSIIERIKLYQRESGKSEMQSLSSYSKKYPNTKSTRNIRLGWIMNGVPVRERNGGGTRSVSISKAAKKEDILQEALNLFFPDGVCNSGKTLSEYSYNLLDFKEHVFENTLTIAEMYKITGLGVLRFYLSTNSINESLSPEENTKKRTKTSKRQNPKKSTRNRKGKNPDRKQLLDEKNEDEITKRCDELGKFDKNHNMDELNEFFVFENDKDDCLINEKDISSHSLNLQDDLIAYDRFQDQKTILGTLTQIESNYNQPTIVSPNGDFFEQIVVSQEALISTQVEFPTALSSSKTITVHRGQIFKEITIEFLNFENFNTFIDIEIIGSNGIKELAMDGGGVFKDALTEYWEEFYESICEGCSCKIPELNHMYSNKNWKAIAKVLLIGYKQVKYFPIKLPRPFIEYATLGHEQSDLIEVYLNFIPSIDAEVLRKVLLDFDSVDYDEIVDVLSNLNCKQIVNKNNIRQVIYDLAHIAILQKPMYILDCFGEILKNKFSCEDLNYIYQHSIVTNKSVLQLIATCDFQLDVNKDTLMGYLKRFIREADNDLLCKFLRFCTGANIISCSNIQIEFNHLEGAERRPTSHTCNNILVLPVSYASDSYRVFKLELNNVLKSNFWSMDLV